MSAAAQPAPRRHLRAITDDGEIVDNPEVTKLEEELAKVKGDLKAAEKDLVTKRRQITELRRDQVRERLEYSRHDEVRKVHDYWNRRMGHKQSLTADRFDAVRGILEEKRIEVVNGKARKVDAFEYPTDFKRAIDGGWYDPFVTKQKNGREKQHNDLALICRDGKTFQSFIDRAPAPSVPVQCPEAFVTEWA